MIFKSKQKTKYNYVDSTNITSILLENREIVGEQNIKDFLNPQIDHLLSPFIFSDMKIVVEKLKNATKFKKRILIFGDYDVDGICSTAILYKLLSKLTQTYYFLPSRSEDGYGLTIDSVNKAISLYNPDLIITVDCGITCYQEVEYIKSKNIDVIVTDHHELPEKLPICPIINPKLTEYKDLCGAGVALKVAQAYLNKIDVFDYIAIASIATIADIVSLKGDNRIITKFGLQNLNLLPKGVLQLFKSVKLDTKKTTSTDIAFKIAPRLNSAGRMGDATISLKLFISDDKKEIEKSLEFLNEMNLLRQQFTMQCFNDCKAIIEQEFYASKNCIIMKGNWDSGILGIVCAKVVETFNKSCILFSISDDGLLKGSCRTVENVNAVDLLNGCSDLIERFGGHKMAAGLTLNAKNFDAFVKRFESLIDKQYGEKHCEITKYYDCEIALKDITLDFVNQVKKLEPFGCNNIVPVFKIHFDNYMCNWIGKNKEHLKIECKNSPEVIAFNMDNHYFNFTFCKSFEALAQVDFNEYMGKIAPQIVLRDLKFCGYKQNKIIDDLLCNFDISNLVFSNNDKSIEYVENIEQLISSFDKNYCIVCNDTKMLNPNIKCDINYVNCTSYADNCLIVAPINYDFLNRFCNVIFTYVPNDINTIKNKYKNCNFYYKNSSNTIKIKCDRSIFGNYFNLIKNCSQKYKNFYNNYDIFLKCSSFDKNILFNQFIICYNVFKELNIIVETTKNNRIELNFNKIKNDLNNSKLFNYCRKLNEK